jgi:hypothetical protein
VRGAAIFLTKYYPIVSTFNIAVLMILDLCGIDANGWTGYVVGCTLWSTALLLCLSYMFYFCSWHRVLLVNSLLYSIVGVMNKHEIYVNFYAHLFLFTIILTIIVASFLYYRHGCFKVATKGTKVDRYGLSLRGVRQTTSRGQRGSNKNINNVLL